MNFAIYTTICLSTLPYKALTIICGAVLLLSTNYFLFKIKKRSSTN